VYCAVQEMSKTYTNVIVLKVDVDECEVSADVFVMFNNLYFS